MLRHCPIPRFSSASNNTKKKMPKSLPKEKAPQAPPESLAVEHLDPKEVAKEPSQKVLKIFSINIITQGLPFCRRRVSECRIRWHIGSVMGQPFCMLNIQALSDAVLEMECPLWGNVFSDGVFDQLVFDLYEFYTGTCHDGLKLSSSYICVFKSTDGT